VTTAIAPARLGPAPVRLFQPDAADRRARTLEEAVLAAVESRRLRGASACLVCGSEVDASGECRSCGSELS
jgi:hypothetical protein